jgi:hypothetical protein
LTIIAMAMTLPSIRTSWFGDRCLPWRATRSSSGRIVPALTSGVIVPFDTPPR